MSTIRPLKTKVLVAENAVERKSESGIILEGVNTGETKTAKVLAIGPDVTDVAVGDIVYLDWSKCSVAKIDDKYRAMIDQEFIIAVVEQ